MRNTEKKILPLDLYARYISTLAAFLVDLLPFNFQLAQEQLALPCVYSCGFGEFDIPPHRLVVTLQSHYLTVCCWSGVGDAVVGCRSWTDQWIMAIHVHR